MILITLLVLLAGAIFGLGILVGIGLAMFDEMRWLKSKEVK